MATRPTILFDTDPGADDAIALLWLLALHLAGRIELHAVTTTGGNVDRRMVFANASRICALTGARDVKVARGVAYDGPHATHIHGDDGLAGQAGLLPPSPLAFDEAQSADRVLVDALNARPDAITVVAVGPLTNLAAADRLQRGCLRQAKRIVVMGGGLGLGNVTAHAEFNVYHNAQAWRAVLGAALADIVTINITRGVSLAAGDLPEPRAPSDTQRFFLAVARSMAASTSARSDAASARTHSNAPGFLLHDAVAVAAACYPHLLQFRDAALDVVVDDGERHGMMFEDAHAEPNARLATAADRNALIDALLSDTLETMPR